MTRRITREPIRTVDTDGAPIVLVPLANHDRPAKLLAEDFDRLVAQGLPLAWTLNQATGGNAYVRCATSAVVGRLVTVARLILRVGRGRVVKYRDGDRLNLRRDNLWATNGPAKHRTISEVFGHGRPLDQPQASGRPLNGPESHWLS